MSYIHEQDKWPTGSMVAHNQSAAVRSPVKYTFCIFCALSALSGHFPVPSIVHNQSAAVRSPVKYIFLHFLCIKCIVRPFPCPIGETLIWRQQHQSRPRHLPTALFRGCSDGRSEVSGVEGVSLFPSSYRPIKVKQLLLHKGIIIMGVWGFGGSGVVYALIRGFAYLICRTLYA